MSQRIWIGEEADAELAEATRWYERQRAGLGMEFLAAVDAAMSRVESNPPMGARLDGVRGEAIRRVFVQRFPYHVVYIELPDRIQVLAVAHDRRKPRYWVGRIPS